MLIIGNKKFRNLQEQVGYNTEQIDKIFETLDGINVQDNLVKLTSASGILTADEMEIVTREVAFIEYNANLYIKSNTTASEFIFKQVALSASDQGTYKILQSFRIVITKASGAYAYSSNTVLSLYDKAEMDALLADKADDSALTAGLALKADLAGANFTGGITSPSIIEDMNGYSFVASTTASATFTYAYAGVVKNGNKLTFVIAGTVNSSSVSAEKDLGTFRIPSAIGDKLFPISSNYISYRKIQLFTAPDSAIEVYQTTRKDSSTAIRPVIKSGTLTNGTDYYFRYEETFLLSDNLAS